MTEEGWRRRVTLKKNIVLRSSQNTNDKINVIVLWDRPNIWNMIVLVVNYITLNMSPFQSVNYTVYLY